MTAIKNGTLLVKDSNGNTARVATLSQTDITTLNTALADIDANKKKINSISANYVTTNTEQTITGKKTLTTTNKSVVTKIIVTNTDNTVTPTENLWVNAVNVVDKNTKNAGSLQFSRHPDGMNWVRLQAANQNANGDNIFHAISIGLKADGTASTSAPNPASNSNDTSIATTFWVNEKVNPIKNNYVTTNTAQDISAPKTFVGDNGNTINLVSNNIDYDNPPSTPTDGKVIFFSDKKNKNLGAIYSGVYSNSDGIAAVFSRLQAHNDKNTIVPNAYLEVQSTTWGTMTAYAPSTITHTNMAEIATTDWVNSKITASHIGPPNYNASIFIAAGTTYTCPSNGWLLFVNDVYDTRSKGYLNGAKVFESAGQAGTWEDWNSLFIFAWKGNPCSITANAHILFWPCA